MIDHRKAFQDEAHDLLAELEEAILDLEDTPDDMDLVGRIFRAMHTIKGSGSMFGFDNVAEFTHNVETVYDKVRDGEVPVTKPLLDISLKACDQIKKMVDDESTDPDIINELVSGFQSFLPKIDSEDTSEVMDEIVSSKKPRQSITYRIMFKPESDIFMTGTNPLLLLDELCELGSNSLVISQWRSIPPLEELDAEKCYLSWDIIITTDKGINTIKDVFIFVEDECEITIDKIDESDLSEDEAEYKKIGEILVDRGRINKDKLINTLRTQPRIGDLLIENELASKDEIDSALLEQQHVRVIREKRRQEARATTIKVPSDKLDRLVDLVGELVISQERLNQIALAGNNPELVSVAEAIEQMTSDLRDNTMSIRMLPIGTTFSRFKRLVRDLSDDLNKDVDLITDGGETELDKTLIERLNDPLVHIIRNSIDHGIEPPDVRVAAGKQKQGTVHLSAEHSGANVLITIKDDGAGLNRKAIFEKAVSKNLIEPDAKLSDADVFAIIFQPGFSTAQKVTGVSGRGVGMDVVKRNIESLGGSIEIASTQGSGTTITLKLPLTLAIIDGLMVKIGNGFFVMPLSAIEECIELSRDKIKSELNRNMVNLRGNIVPYIRLRDIFMTEGSPPDIERIVIGDVNGKSVGFVVDQVLGEYQTVIKSLGILYKNIEGLSGATILGDGTVALILDLPKLVSIDKSESNITQI